MKISDLSNNSRRVDIEATIVEMDDPRDVDTKFGKTRVANAFIEDDTGRFKLVLWGEHIDLVRIGSKIKISNGFITSFRDEMQLSVGKFGKLEVKE